MLDKLFYAGLVCGCVASTTTKINFSMNTIKTDCIRNIFKLVFRRNLVTPQRKSKTKTIDAYF